MSGEGEIFQTVERLFHITCQGLGLNRAEGGVAFRDRFCGDF